MRFRVEQIVEVRGDVIALARQLDEGNFVLSDTPRLGGIPVRPDISQPRALTSEGEPDLTVFAFHLVTASDRVRLSGGQTVDLT